LSFAASSAVIGGGFFAIQWIISRGKFVGSGDIILAAGIGAFLGDEYLLLLAMSFAYVLGAIIAGGLLLSGLKKRESHIALAPFLIVGTLVVFLWGEQILALM
jgi:prepilin signal peptidase PulO-like enzyme (type II secretory pathway)